MGIVSAQFGSWDDVHFCLNEQEKIVESPKEPRITLSECMDFCQEHDRITNTELYEYLYGKKRCCDFEDQQEGMGLCILYFGDELSENIPENYGVYNSMIFDTGDYDLCFTWDNLSWVGTTPFNPASTQCGLDFCTPCPSEDKANMVIFSIIAFVNIGILNF